MRYQVMAGCSVFKGVEEIRTKCDTKAMVSSSAFENDLQEAMSCF